MKKKPIAILLCMAMLCSLLSMLSFATDGQEEATDDATTACTVCGSDDCTENHEVTPVDEGGESDEGENESVPETSFYDSLINAASFDVLYHLMTDTSNSVALSALNYEQLEAVDGKINQLYEGLEKKDADTEYQKKLLRGQIETLIAQNDDNFTEFINSCTCPANKSRLVVHATNCPAYIEPPKAIVKEIGKSVKGGFILLNKVEPFQMDLTYAMQFATQESYTEKQEAYYGMWVADFVITTNKSITGADAYLAGQFDLFNEAKNDPDKNWVKLEMPTERELKAGESLQLIPVVTGMTFPFLGVVKYIPTFNCGIYVTENYLQQNPDFAVSVELRLYPSNNGEDYDVGNYYTLSEINYQTQNATIKYVAGTSGTVSEDEEIVGTLVEPKGSTPNAKDGYHFAGWYKDSQYKEPVPSGWVDAKTGALIPGRNTSGTYVDATYYAKFDPNVVDLQVTLSGGENTSIYLFTLVGNGVNLKLAVKGGESITIQDLPIGDYTIAMDNNWNWRETVKVEMDGSLTEKDVTATVTVTSNGNKQWFNGYAYWPTAE